MKLQRGFTLIELVVVIIILGVLSAVAVPKFIDVSVDARNAAAKGVAGAISSGSSINYAAKQVGNTSAVLVNQANVCDATVLSNFVTTSTAANTNGVQLVATAAALTKDNQFLITGTGNCSGNAATANCTIQPKGSTATQSAIVFCAR